MTIGKLGSIASRTEQRPKALGLDRRPFHRKFGCWIGDLAFDSDALDEVNRRDCGF